jgi:type IV secretory pathway VirB3-like protein
MIHGVTTDLVVIPGGMTSKLHIIVNNPVNDHLKLYCKWFLV